MICTFISSMFDTEVNSNFFHVKCELLFLLDSNGNNQLSNPGSATGLMPTPEQTGMVAGPQGSDMVR
jgi:hypothetical protein